MERVSDSERGREKRWGGGGGEEREKMEDEELEIQ